VNGEAFLSSGQGQGMKLSNLMSNRIKHVSCPDVEDGEVFLDNLQVIHYGSDGEAFLAMHIVIRSTVHILGLQEHLKLKAVTLL